MSMGIAIKRRDDGLVRRLAGTYNNLWLGAEVFLFVLVGVAVDLNYAKAAGVAVILLVAAALVFRMAVISILLTAPFGAICIDNTHRKLLER